MIWVEEKTEPTDFNAKVRVKGERFLRLHPHCSSGSLKRYWSNCIDDLYTEYNNTCAYTAAFLPANDRSVDHYYPKQGWKEFAYEWSNYRLSLPRVNSHKDKELDVMDPFHIKNGWFIVDFTSFNIFPEDSLPSYLQTAITSTIKRLQLNRDPILRNARIKAVVDYAKQEPPFEVFRRYYPFIACELERQGLEETIKPLARTISI